MEHEVHVVTGAFGYSGKYIATRLLAENRRVRTLTNSLNRPNPFGGKIEAHPFNFDHPEKMAEVLRGAKVLYNTYWVRFNYSFFKHKDAVHNTLKLFEAAKQAGVERVVHVSISNPSEDSPLEYFSGKARLERELKESGLSFAILRPTILFGQEDILINNIAWALRHLPVFGIFGGGQYKVQPIYVDDLAALAVEQGKHHENITIDAVGPQTFTYRDLVRVIGENIGARRPSLSLPPALAYIVGSIIGRLNHDVMITWPEIKGLMAGLLCTESTPAGRTRLTEWVREYKDTLGLRYASELARRIDRTSDYAR